MSDMGEQTAAEPVQGLTQWQRVANTFTAPSKTFDDIRQGNKSWWLPFLISIAFVYVFFAAVTVRVGWDQVAQNAIHLNPKAEAKLDQAPPEQRAMSLKFTQYAMEGGLAASPIIAIAGTAIAAVVLLGTINFVFGGRAKFGSVFTVWMFAGLPGIIKFLLGTVVIFAGLAPESFNMENFAPTNAGAFLSAQDVGPALYRLATAVDVITIWTMILAGMGCGSSRGQAQFGIPGRLWVVGDSDPGRRWLCRAEGLSDRRRRNEQILSRRKAGPGDRGQPRDWPGRGTRTGRERCARDPGGAGRGSIDARGRRIEGGGNRRGVECL